MVMLNPLEAGTSSLPVAWFPAESFIVVGPVLLLLRCFRALASLVISNRCEGNPGFGSNNYQSTLVMRGAWRAALTVEVRMLDPIESMTHIMYSYADS
jgi:hypothetical protein